MMNRKARRSANPINAGSMADIAFLLLIFFLVTTTILQDSGIYVALPPYDPDFTTIEVHDRDVLNIKINAQDQLLLENEIATIDQVKETTKTFILNPEQLADLPASPQKAIVSIQNDRGTSYAAYLAVYNEIKAAYNEIWEVTAKERFGQSYLKLPKEQQRKIRKEIPLIISEAEPTEHGVEG